MSNPVDHNKDKFLVLYKFSNQPYKITESYTIATEFVPTEYIKKPDFILDETITKSEFILTSITKI